MKKLDTNKLTEKQADLFKNNLVYIATVDGNGNPQVGPKGSMTVLDPSHMQYLEKTKGAAFENIKNGSKVALVAADVPSHTAVQVLATPHVHEDDEYAKKVVSGTDTPNAFVVVLDIDEIFE